MFPEELVFVLVFLAMAGIPVLGFLAWGTWVVYDNERNEPPAGRAVTAWMALALSVPAGVVLMLPRIFFEVERLGQLLVFLLLGALLVACSTLFTAERVA
jgi:uncharacterized iron-regulated membrane protein